MKKIKISILLLIGIVGLTYGVSQLWKADNNSSVSWEIDNGSKKGTFEKFSTELIFDESNLSKSSLSATIDVNSIKAGNEELEAHLKTSDFFEVDKFPNISFKSTNLKKEGEAYVAEGNLTIKEVTKAVLIPFSFKKIDDNKAEFYGSFTINASEYGVMKKPKTEGKDKVSISIKVPVIK